MPFTVELLSFIEEYVFPISILGLTGISLSSSILEHEVNWSQCVALDKFCSVDLMLWPNRTLFKDFSSANFKEGLIEAPFVCMAIDGPGFVSTEGKRDLLLQWSFPMYK